jgi:Putative exporter of polyketide antibiotics
MTLKDSSFVKTNPDAKLPIFRRDTLLSWRGLVGWSAGLIAVCALYLPIYPAMAGDDLQNLLANLPSELIDTLGYSDISSGAGYLQAAVFGLLGFIFLTIAGVSWGAAAIAGTEESGSLELTLAHGISRFQYALQAACAIIVKLLILGSITFLTILAFNKPSQINVAVAGILAATLAWVGLGALTAMVSLCFGAMTGSRKWAIGAGSAVAVAGYVFQALANNSERLKWLDSISPFSWAYEADPLTNGFDWGGLALLWGFSLLFLVAAIAALMRRDIKG